MTTLRPVIKSEFDRFVALKIPHTGLLTNNTQMERRKREARAAAQFRHPGIVTVHDVEMLDPLSFAPTFSGGKAGFDPCVGLLHSQR